jgi:hypothetical protein
MIRLTIEGEVEKNKGLFIIRLKFDSNVDFKVYGIDKIIPIDYDGEVTDRLIDEMFYELKRKAKSDGGALKRLLNSLKKLESPQQERKIK